MENSSVAQSFSPVAQPSLSKTHEGTKQNFASQKDHKYVSTYKSLLFEKDGE